MGFLVTSRDFITSSCKDASFAFRQLLKSPGFTSTVILTLTLGIGINTAIFSVMNAVLLRMLPVRNPQQLFYVSHESIPVNVTYSGDSRYATGLHVYNRLLLDRSVISDVIAYVPLSLNKTPVRFGEHPEEVRADEVSGNFFQALGIPMAVGRSFGPRDEELHSSIAILSYGFWTSRFNRDPGVIGKTVYIRGVPFTIAAIAARGFYGVDSGGLRRDLWIPLQDRPELPALGVTDSAGGSIYQNPNLWATLLMVRIKPGVTLREASARLSPIYAQASNETFQERDRDPRPLNLQFVPVRGLGTETVELRQPVTILMGMVLLVQAIACANIVLLLLARSSVREREFALRLALGAGRWPLFRILLAESLLLVAAGTLLAWLFAVVATRLLGYWSKFEVSLAPDASVLAFTIAVSSLCAIIFGLAPLRSAAGASINYLLKTFPTARSTMGRSWAVLGNSLVVVEIIFCLVLLMAMGLLVRTLRNYQKTDLGMRATGVLVFGVHPLGIHSFAENVVFYKDLLKRLKAVQGIRSVTMAQIRPGTGSTDSYPLIVDGRKYPFEWGKVEMRYNWVAENYFDTMGIPLVAGREIRDSDTSGSPRVAVVNQTLALGYFKDGNAIGHYVGEDKDEDHLRAQIVGIARDSKFASTDEEKVPMAWYSYQQVEMPFDMDVEVRTGGNPLDRLPAIQRVVHAIDPNIALADPQVLSSVFDKTYGLPVLYARLAVFFGCLAALLVAVGLNGMLAYRVNRRRSEIGIRMALGATRTQVLWMILRDTVYLVAIGLGIGLPLAWFTSRLMTAMLFHLSARDPISFGAAAVGVIVVSICSGLIPAQRAAAVQPMQTLRVE